MPPERQPATDSETSDPSKKSKTSSDTDAEIPKSKRWLRASGSANADNRYKLQTKDPEVAYSFMTICQPPFWDDDDEDEDMDEDEDENMDKEEDESRRQKSNCDGGKTCCCKKPAAERPDHPWVISKAGHVKFYTAQALTILRVPDVFGMYIHNDFEAYGAIEVVENLLQDYHDALLQKNWKEQWIICEAMALMWGGDTVSAMSMADDSERVGAVVSLITRMVLNALSKLEALNLLKRDSEVKSLGLVMALFIVSFEKWQDVCENYSDPNKRYKPEKFDSYLAAYAKKFEIQLKGPPGIDDAVAELDDEDVSLQSCTLKDPWEWKKYLGAYRKEYGYNPGILAARTKSIGGDSYDITAWDSAERKKFSFTKKDPLTKKEIEAIKNGDCMDLA